MPVPGGGFEAEMLARGEIAPMRADQVHDQEDRAHQHVEAVEAGRHVEGRAVGAAAEGERRMGIFIGLDRGEERAQDRSEEHTSELQSLMRISYAVLCLKKKKQSHH